MKHNHYINLYISKQAMADQYSEDRDTREECRDYRRNVCTKGDDCKYYHPPRDLASIFERNSVCHDFQNAKGCHRESCKFLHLTKEQEDHIKNNGACPPSLSQQEMDKIMGLPPFCNDFMRGICKRGSSCKFRHVGEPGAPGGGGGGGRGPHRGFPDRGADRFDPYRRPSDDPYDRMEMKRRYREDMMEDEIMYLRAQVSRLKRQVADLAATNESLMTENARLRVDRSRVGSLDALPTSSYDARITPSARPGEFSITSARSAYPYTSGLKLEPPSSQLTGVTSLTYSGSAPLY